VRIPYIAEFSLRPVRLNLENKAPGEIGNKVLRNGKNSHAGSLSFWPMTKLRKPPQLEPVSR
jgi:hypothetical protein